MIYASVCDGIGAAHVAWQPLGMRCLWTSEIEPFPIAVVEQRWGLENLGDMLADDLVERAHGRGRIDVLVGGTPCQSFSVAGKRMGLDDPRGRLALRYVELVDDLRPRWVVWENVPGVLSSGRGRDFGAFVGSLVRLGYGVCWRVLDAQYVRVESHPRAVPQRRRRVFAVGCLGNWRGAAAVLLEREGMRGHPAPGREAGKGVACALTRSIGTWADDVKAQASHIVAGALQARDFKGVNSTLDMPLVSHTLRGDGHDAGEDGTGRGVPLVFAHPINEQVGTRHISLGERTGLGIGDNGDPAFTLQRDHPHAVATNQAVRRLTPRECERLQGFPDDYTAIQFRGKPATDAPRYRALGNSMAVNVMSWIGQRLQQADSMIGCAP